MDCFNKIRLLVPFEDKDLVKQHKCRWDVEGKYWYYLSEDKALPDELKKYKAYPVLISYDEKDEMKQRLKSMKWDSVKKAWFVNQADYDSYKS